jgi:hypothetical protein
VEEEQELKVFKEQQVQVEEEPVLKEIQDFKVLQ